MEPRNRIREALEAGDAVLGARATTMDPMVVEAYGDVGLDFVWLDFEHTGPSGFDAPVFEELTRAAEVGGVDLLVRPPSGDPHLIRKLLDAGVRTVLVPRVETAAEVREAVRASRFSYADGPGRRGAAAGRSTVWGPAPDDYVNREDDSVCVGVMVETLAAVENLADILSVPDLGFAFVGPSDLSIALGHPLETDHPEVRETADAIADACLDAGVPLGGIRNDASAARDAVEEGYQVLRIGDELSAARSVLGERVGAIRD